MKTNIRKALSRSIVVTVLAVTGVAFVVSPAFLIPAVQGQTKKKISELPTDPSPTVDDLIPTVDNPGGTPVSKQATIANITKGLNLSNATTGTLPVARGGTGTTTSTGSGNVVLSTSPTLVTPALGTPASATLTNATGLPLTTGVTGTLPVANGGTGITAFGTGVAAWLGTPSSANLATATTDESGSGALIFGTSPTISGASLTSDTSFDSGSMYYNATTDRLYIGSSSRNSLTNLVISGTSGTGGIQINRNTSGSPANADVLGSLGFKGLESANSNAAAEAKIEAIAVENHSGSTAATDLVFYNKPTGTGPGNSPKERVRIYSGGDVGLISQTSASAFRFYEPSGSGTNYTALKAQAQSADVTYTLPAADGTNGQVLSTNGSGTLSWATAGGGGLSYFTEARSTSSPNATVPVHSFTASGNESTIDLAIIPKGSNGSILSDIPDNGVGGGNRRGAYAVDLQMTRSDAAQVASGNYSSIPGGSDNTASGGHSVARGYANIASGTQSIAEGWSNQATAAYSRAVGGQALANKQGQYAQASAAFDSRGDAQISTLIARRSTTNNTQTELFLDGSSSRCTIATDTSWAFTITVIARRTDADGEASAWEASGVICNDAGTTRLVDTVTATLITQDIGAAFWAVDITADNTNDALAIKVTGDPSETIRWVAKIELVEVSG